MNEENNGKKTLEIIIDSLHTIVCRDGKQLCLTAKSGKAVGKPGKKSKTTWITGLYSLNNELVFKGIRKPWELQTYQKSSETIREALGSLMAIQERSKRKQPLSASFGHGDFRITFTPMNTHGAGGHWTLINPGHTITRLPEASGNVGYLGSATQAVWLAVERSLLASEETIEYTELAERVLAVTKYLTSDLKVERTK